MTDLVQILKLQKDYENEERVLRYREMTSLLKGEHKDLFLNINSTRDTLNSPYITVNLPAAIAKKQADLMFLKGIEIDLENEKLSSRIKEILTRNNFNKTCYKQGITASALGGCFFRVRWGLINKYNSEKDIKGKEKNNEVIIEAVNPENVFPEIQNDRIIACTIKYIERQPKVDFKDGVKYDEFYIEEHYEPGLYKKSVYIINKTRNGIELSLLEKPQEALLPFTDIPVVYIPNALEHGFYGISDFDDKLDLIHEINNTMSRISSAVRRYTYPILVATEDWIKKAKLQGSVFTQVRSPIDHIRPNGEQVKIKVEDIGITAAPRDKQGKFQDVFKFIEYNPDLKEIREHLNMCENTLLKLCSISPALLETDKVLSGKALRLKLTNTLVMIEAKKALWTEGIKEIIKTALLIDNVYNKNHKVKNNVLNGLDSIRIIWGEIFPDFVNEKLQSVMDKVKSGLMSKKRAVMMLENVDEKEALDILKEIGEENNELKG